MISYINKKNNINNISFKNSFIIKVLRGSHKYKNIYLYKYVRKIMVEGNRLLISLRREF